jgi:hypothetical protein
MMYLRRSDQDWINRNVIAPQLAAGPRRSMEPPPPPGKPRRPRRLVPMLRRAESK